MLSGLNTYRLHLDKLARNQRRLREEQSNANKHNMFKKDIQIVKISPSANSNLETNKCHLLRIKLLSVEPWSLVKIEDNLIIPDLENKNQQQIYNAPNAFWTTVKNSKQVLFLMGLEGFIVQHEVPRASSYLTFAWRTDSTISKDSFNSKQSRLHGQLWDLLPRAKDICRKLSSESNLPAVLLESIIKVIHPDCLGQAKARNKQEQESIRRYTKILQNQDREQEREEMLLDIRKLNKLN